MLHSSSEEWNRAAVEIALPYMCGAEIRAARRNSFDPRCTSKADSKIFDPSPEIDAQHAERYGHCCLSPALRPARVVLWVGAQWQQMQAEEVDAATTKAPGDRLQVARTPLASVNKWRNVLTVQ